MDLQLEGNAGIITASSSGLGKSSATELAREGVNVIINGRNEDKLADAADEIRNHSDSEVVPVQGDIKKREVTENIVETAIDKFGRLDHLVTSAGGPPSGKTLETTDKDWHESFNLLVMSVFRLVKKAAPYILKDGGGTIVNITSISVKEALDSLVLSNSIRMSVIGLAKTLSRELAPKVRVNSVLPGPHRTPRIDGLIDQALEREEFDSRSQALEKWSEDIPLNRIGDPAKLGRLVAFLSSPQSGFINGSAITIDGGSSRSNL